MNNSLCYTTEQMQAAALAFAFNHYGANAKDTQRT
jgi:hypothetical protein